MGAQKRQKDLQNQLKNVFIEQMKNDSTQMMKSNGLNDAHRKKNKGDEVDMSDFKIND
jgi:hypothetical protein